jgi:hypothetical protein
MAGRHRYGSAPAWLFVSGLALAAAGDASAAPPTWPTAREVWTDPFEGPGLGERWEDQGGGRIRIATDAAHGGSSGLVVDVSGADQTYLQLYNLTPWPHLEFPRDTYVRFAFHPHGATIPAGETIALVRLRDGDWNVMAGLRLRQAAAGYELLLELPDGTVDSTPLPLSDEWHTIVLGCRPHDWIGAWVDDTAPRIVEGVTHAADFVQVLLFGKPDGSWSGTTPSGTVYYDDVTLLFGSYPELWVDAAAGDDASEGNASGVPLATLGAAAILSAPGTAVHVAPGDYREAVVQPTDGTEEQPIVYSATGGRGTAHILGSNRAADATWTRLADPAELDLPAGVDPATATIWKADLSSWSVEHAPYFVLVRAADGSFTRMPRAREPDWQVATPWKHHEFWWSAEGGARVTTCDPVAEPDCDAADRSDRHLLDYHDDAIPAGVEPGSLASLGDVTGAIVFVKDCWSGHYTYRRRVAETVEPGHVRLEALPEAYTEGCWFDHDPANPALGWNSKYFLEGLAKFMDTPGEWHFDETTRTLYVWTPDGRSPAELGVEISVRETGFDLSGRSYVELRDLDIEVFEGEGINISNSDTEPDRSYGLTLAGLDIGWATRGLFVGQAPVTGSPAGSQIRHLVLRDSVIHDIDSLAIFTWAGNGESWVRPGITDFLVVHNEFANVGFRDNEQGAVGLSFHLADHFLFEGNWVHDIAHNGVHFSQAHSAPTGSHPLSPEEILTGDVLVRGNLFERCVQNATDAGGLKFWGAVADDSDAFRDVLVTGNVSRNNVGWAWVSEQRDNWTYGGKGGMGYYIDYAGGIHFFRNVAYENGLAGFMASGSWYDQPVVLANNTFVNSPDGYDLGIRAARSSANTGFHAVNNIFAHLQEVAFGVGDERILRGDVELDHDLFSQCGYADGRGLMAGHVDSSGYRELATLADVQGIGFEANGREGDPLFASFDPAITDGSWQDFRLTTASTLAIDTGGELPESLTALLAKFGLTDGRKGAALDRGAIEFDPDNPGAPFTIEVGPTDGTAAITTPWDGEEPPPDAPPAAGGGGGGCGCRAADAASSAAGGCWLATAAATLLAGAAFRRRRAGPRPNLRR